MRAASPDQHGSDETNAVIQRHARKRSEISQIARKKITRRSTSKAENVKTPANASNDAEYRSSRVRTER